jgi:hypothetical protein
MFNIIPSIKSVNQKNIYEEIIHFTCFHLDSLLIFCYLLYASHIDNLLGLKR